jgi:hypothetical protein
LYGQGFFSGSRGPFRVRFSTQFTGGHGKDISAYNRVPAHARPGSRPTRLCLPAAGGRTGERTKNRQKKWLGRWMCFVPNLLRRPKIGEKSVEEYGGKKKLTPVCPYPHTG